VQLQAPLALINAQRNARAAAAQQLAAQQAAQAQAQLQAQQQQQQQALIASVPAVSAALQQILTNLGRTPKELLRLDALPLAQVNPIFTALGTALNQPPNVPNRTVLLTFIQVIEHLPTSPEVRQDDQMLAIALGRSLIDCIVRIANANAVLCAMADMVRGVNMNQNRVPHVKSLGTELAEVGRQVTSDIATNPDAQVLVGYTLGAGAVPLAIAGAIKVASVTTARMLKQDKTGNKAINLLTEAVTGWVRPQRMNPALATKITELLRDLPPSKHLKRLYDVFKAHAAPAQLRATNAVLQRAGRMG